MDRMTHRSSAQLATFGNSELGGFRFGFAAGTPTAISSTQGTIFGKREPSLEWNWLAMFLNQASFRSNVSMLEGPPCMNKKITRFTFGSRSRAFGQVGSR